MIILGIDPGSRNTGYALININGKKLTYIASGTIVLTNEKDFNKRLCRVHEEVTKIVEKYKPSEIAFESLIYVKNPTSLIKLSQTRGAMISALGKLAKVFEYAPNTIKSAVTGHGHATKESIQKTLKMIYGELVYKTHDESDALAIATCHGLSRKFGRTSVSKSKPSSLRNAFKHFK